MAEHDTITARGRGRRLARRIREHESDPSMLRWEPSAATVTHLTRSEPAGDDPDTRLDRLRAIRDHLSSPDPA